MTAPSEPHSAAPRPRLTGPRVTIRPGVPGDVAALQAILSEPSVVQWWSEPEPGEEVARHLLVETEAPRLIIEIGGEVAGGIEYYEELDPQYRHAGIDVFLGARFQDHGYGTEAVRLLARFLIEQRGHHRLVIDPSVENQRAIAAYRKVGFRPVGVMRRYELHGDGQWHDGLLMDMLRDELTAP